MRPARSLLPALALVTLASAVVLAACGQDDDPEGARVLWEKINAAPGFQSWQRAPGFATRKPSFTLHSREVEIFVNDKVSATLTTRTELPVTEWPVGSIIVKEGYSGNTRSQVAVMEKRDNGWFWAEYFSDDGVAKYSGQPTICTDCHDNRRDYSDWVYAFELPR
jgi:hypothetical protein